MAGPGPIPFSAIDRYAARFGIEGRDEFAHFMRLIRTMDGAWLKWVSERSKEQTGKDKERRDGPQ